MAQLYANFIKAGMDFQLVYFMYFLALLAYGCSHFPSTFKDGKDRIYQAARLLFMAAWALNAYFAIQRGLTAGRPPTKTYFESLIYFTFIFGLLSLAVEWTRRVRLLGFISLSILFSALTFALSNADAEIITPSPSLRSAWFLPHATLYLAGFSSLTLAFILGILALAKPDGRVMESGAFWTPALGGNDTGNGIVDFEKMNRQWVRAGFLLLACGLVTGAFWAKSAWSDYWAWDPKENWGLIGLLVYGAVLHMHHVPSLKGRKAIWGSIFAWGFILFTYFGMGKLPTRSQSMHRYTEPSTPGEAEVVNGVNKRMH